MGRRWALLAIAALAGAVSATPVGAQPAAGDGEVMRDTPFIARGAPPIRQQSITASGTPVILFHYFAVGPDCEPTAAAIRVVAAPAHGTLDVQDGAERPYWRGASLFAPGDPRSRCSDRLVATRDAVYTPAVGFVGDDRFVVEITEAGVASSDAVDVTVLSLGPPPRR